MDFTQLTDVAILAARAAGRIIQAQRGEVMAVQQKPGGDSYASQVFTKVDLAAEAAIVRVLQPTCDTYDLALLTEETPDDGSRFEKDYFWCVDPLDGTLAFIAGQPGFSVAIALVARDGTPHIGVVYDPSTDILYHATRGSGAYKNGQPWVAQHTNNHLTYVTDKRLADTPRMEEVQLTLKQLRSGLTSIEEWWGGGSVLNAIRVAENGPALMLKLPKKAAGGGSLWDFAATACLFHELGLRATNFAGGLLDLNRRDSTFLNHEGVWYGNLDACSASSSSEV